MKLSPAGISTAPTEVPPPLVTKAAEVFPGGNRTFLDTLNACLVIFIDVSSIYHPWGGGLLREMKRIIFHHFICSEAKYTRALPKMICPK